MLSWEHRNSKPNHLQASANILLSLTCLSLKPTKCLALYSRWNRRATLPLHDFLWI
uniref:Uncharacterized protein n=1 Tax=Arundo donax TaxID=35708 RepID=A0A0A9FX29_ARUDO